MAALAIVIPIALVVGIAMGALGGGVSIITVPALVYLLAQDARAATTGSLIIVGASSLIGMLPHWRAGRVRVGKAIVFGLLGIAGSYAGSRLSGAVEQHVLLPAFSVLLLFVAWTTKRRRKAMRRADAAGEAPPVAVERSRPLPLILTATGVGLLTGFFGVGGGFAVVPALVLALGVSMPVAVGTSLLVIAINSASALAARMGQGVALDWPLIVAFRVCGGGLAAGEPGDEQGQSGHLEPGLHDLAGGGRALHRSAEHSALAGRIRRGSRRTTRTVRRRCRGARRQPRIWQHPTAPPQLLQEQPHIWAVPGVDGAEFALGRPHLGNFRRLPRRPWRQHHTWAVPVAYRGVLGGNTTPGQFPS